MQIYPKTVQTNATELCVARWPQTRLQIKGAKARHANADMPVRARPIASACTSSVPSYVYTLSMFIMCRITCTMNSSVVSLTCLPHNATTVVRPRVHSWQASGMETALTCLQVEDHYPSTNPVTPHALAYLSYNCTKGADHVIFTAHSALTSTTSPLSRALAMQAGSAESTGATLLVSMMPFAPSMARASDATRRAAATLWRLCRLTWSSA